MHCLLASSCAGASLFPEESEDSLPHSSCVLPHRTPVLLPPSVRHLVVALRRHVLPVIPTPETHVVEHARSDDHANSVGDAPHLQELQASESSLQHGEGALHYPLPAELGVKPPLATRQSSVVERCEEEGAQRVGAIPWNKEALTAELGEGFVQRRVPKHACVVHRTGKASKYVLRSYPSGLLPAARWSGSPCGLQRPPAAPRAERWICGGLYLMASPKY